MKTTLKVVYVILALAMLSGCAITNKYGPYMGKVVDKETNEPIEGAVVFMKFNTIGGTIAGDVSYYVDATETLTDAQGEFNIPSHRIYTFRKMQGWGRYG